MTETASILVIGGLVLAMFGLVIFMVRQRQESIKEKKMKKGKVYCVDCKYGSLTGLVCYYEAPKGYKQIDYQTKIKSQKTNPKFKWCSENQKGECKYYCKK